MSSNGNGNGYGHVDRIAGREEPSRLPPHSLEDELALIGSLLRDPSRIPACREVLPDPSLLWRDDHAERYRSILDLHDRGEEINRQSVTADLTRRGVIRGSGPDPVLGDALDRVLTPLIASSHAITITSRALARDVMVAAQEDLRDVERGVGVSELMRRRAARQERIHYLEGLLTIAGPPEEGPDVVAWPEEPAAAAFHGLAGDFVYTIGPHTEADPVAILGQFLAAFGSVIGRKSHWSVERTRHACALFVCVVGNSSKARKGTSWDHVQWLMKAIDPDWRYFSGLSTGEGLLWKIRDPIFRRERAGGAYHEVEVDPGVEDKRALFLESEFGTTLALMNRRENPLSGYLRQFWDGSDVASTTKQSPARVTGGHVTVVAHCTQDDLADNLGRVDVVNGFGNRFLWVLARRSRCLPHGGAAHTVDFAPIVRRLSDAVAFARGDDEAEESCLVTRDDEAAALWERVYPGLTEPHAGLFGAATARAEAQVMRLATIYALLDCSRSIGRAHLEAALAFWRYCEAGARVLFQGAGAADPEREKLLTTLREATARGEPLTAYQARRRAFGGHMTSPRFRALLGELARSGLIRPEKATSPLGRPATTWATVAGP